MRLLRDRVRLMDVLINAMLDYSRAGAQLGNLEEVEVAALVAEVANGGERPPGFTVSIAPDLPRLRTDREHLRQVFANLIGNAMAHHPGPDGHLWVSAQDKGDCYEFVVADDGPGIAPEYQTRIFEMFQHGPGEAPGTGIGLAVVRRVVERLGGRVTLESAPGKGSTFRFSWPKVIRPDDPQRMP
jgi:signal transduction histidine kinase